MASIEVICPGCNAVLKVPDNAVGKKGRCRTCDAIFPIVAPTDIASADVSGSQDDDTILGWLATDDPSQTSAPDATSGKAVSETKTFPVRLDHVDTMGAFFRFSADVLRDEDFRSAFPQQCVICSSRNGLSVHLIVWSGKLASWSRAERRTAQSLFVVPLVELSGARGRKLLEKLPPVENIPEPFCLPMPYYICHSCSALGAIVTDVHPLEDGKGDECELGISSLRIAEKFVMTVRDNDADLLSEIRHARKKRKGDAWQMLPLAIRVRLQRWYQPTDSEKFLAYFQDADYAKAEAGLAGLVVTDKRLVYHKSVAQIEIPLSERIVLNFLDKGKHMQMEISSPSSKVAKLSALPTYVEQLTNLLRRQGQHV